MSEEQPTPPPPPLGELRLHRILAAIDGSPSAELALQAAVTVAQRDHAALTLVAVAVDAAAQAARWVGAVPYQVMSQEEADAAAQRVLADAVARLPEGLPVTTILRRGNPAREILAVADEGVYDVILLGARGVGRVGSLMGSVSQEVLHHAKTAVFVAHAPRDTR